ncbi:MAG TPA: TonB-dependent receptor plug domain-containing protein, partial [Bryobacteraceae bacterium]|nr:TonB-dependent receptor plug domain-containing protein [Bryobacteraceae bacterium]
MRWLTVLLCVSAAAAQEPDLGDASLEQLLQIRVSSASKKIQPLSQVPAAMHVITQDDIRRSGATSLLDILRWVPGLEVAQIDANKWAISSRGFNTRFANKMLVLMDGRSLYGVDFGGIFWDVLDTFLEDVERIEVIRGPGATMWGANAVNGVINIITKHSRETKGSIVQAGGGNRDFGTAQARFGFAAGRSGYARVYAKHVNRGAFPMDNTIGDDRWNSTLGGFRSDWDLGRADRLTVQGDLYRNQRQLNTFLVSLHPPFQVNSGAGGAHGVSTQARWTHTHQNLSQTAVQFYAEGHSHDDGLVL